MIKKVHIIGLGLMGTNLGIKLVEKGVRVSGTDILEKNVIRAKDYGALNNDFDPEENYDLTILAMPIIEIISFFDKKISTIKSKLIIDLGGTKHLIRQKMDHSRIPCIGGHPLCGVADNETWEPNSKIYNDAPFLLCESDSSNAVVRKIASDFVSLIDSREIWIDSEKHDELISLTSHLPHMLSSALVSVAMKEQDLAELLDLASGGFDGATRLSRTSPNMIADMYLTNLENVKDLITKLIDELQEILIIDDEDIMNKYLFETVEWRRALADKFGERDLS